jgi:hypothetical protein
LSMRALFPLALLVAGAANDWHLDRSRRVRCPAIGSRLSFGGVSLPRQ